MPTHAAASNQARKPDRAPGRDGEAEQTAAEAGLRYVSDLDPGITRRRVGDTFSYHDPRGEAVREEATLARIRALAIPPAYRDVWICLSPKGHLQATGRDARGRKQYRYHAQWQQARGVGKFDRVIAFGEALPRLRRHLRRDLAVPGFPRRKVLAMVVAVMAETLLRVGNDSYVRSNKSFGLTTLRNRHVAFVRGGRARFKFRGKGGLAQDIALDDVKLTRLIRRCQQLPGQALFQYRDDDGELQPVDSGEVNDYLREAMGESFTAKDFRTWGGTLAAFQQLACTPLPEPAQDGAPSERALVAAQNEVIRQVATTLGNTPAVCRKAYIDPAVFAGWREGSVQRAAACFGEGGARGARQWEQAALKFLKRARRAAAKAARKQARGKQPARKRATANGTSVGRG
ncbi:DNA topoisomerase IB [Lysobacter sp. D1-1-M9]|uniref:DNA topoisomerase IB n=1 Tax=Novilysobacter longmucuonensis TaxID=3098603 RepID=UPI002FCA7DE3